MTKRKNLEETRRKKQQLWLERTMCRSGLGEEPAQNLLQTKRKQSFRLNPLRTQQGASLLQGGSLLKREIIWGGTTVGYGCSAEELARLRDSELVKNGSIYIQNAASWLPVLALDPRAHNTILDVCAAPGGKASHIQAITNNLSKLTCNDNSKPRLIKLQANMERLGAEASYTLCDATRLSRTLQLETFDKILLDAPCSGEGLMTLDDLKLFDSWSVAHIRRLSELQKKILHESWQLLKPGGTLVYSTCTMAPEENEAVIDYFLRKHPDARLELLDFPLENRVPALTSWNDRPFKNDLSACLRLVPGELTEAFFVAKLRKIDYSDI